MRQSNKESTTMSDETINDLFNRLRGQKNGEGLSVSKRAIGSADQSLIIDKSEQPGWWSRFLIKQSGGYNPQYYKKDEVDDTTRLAIAKFASVSLATYSFMKAVSPAFDNNMLKSLPSVYEADPKLILTGVTAAGFWWMLSKLDTAVLHNMSAHKASAAAAEQYGVSRGKSKIGSAAAGVALRYGVSLGSLAITIPALLVTVGEETVDQYLQDKIYTEYNKPLLEEYQSRLDKVTGEVTRLNGLLTPLEQRLLSIDADEDALTYTEEQQGRRKSLGARLEALEEQRKSLAENQLKEIRIRDEAISRMLQEESGTRGSTAGQGPLYRDAMADRDDALRRLETINAALSGVRTQINGINTELSNIDAVAQTALDSRNEAQSNLRTNLQDQIALIREQLATQNALQESASDITALALDDPRWVSYNPNLFDQANGYLEYMQEEANIFQWMSAGAIALMIACMELGVFTLAASRRAGPGEVRAYMAEVLKSDEAGKIYQQVVARKILEEEIGLDPTILELRKQKKLMEAEEKVFDRLVRKAMKNAGIEEAMFDDIVADLQDIRYKRSFKMDDVPKPDATVSPEEDNTADPVPEQPYKPNGGKPRPDNLG